MSLSSGSLDIWNWSLALSEPMGYAGDMVLTPANGLTYDSGTTAFVRNSTGPGGRSGPAYWWNGTTQNLTRGNGTASILDPAYFLLDKTLVVGNMALGDTAYHNVTYGCFNCHGANGEGNGLLDDGPALIGDQNINRFSWQTFQAFVTGSTSAPHDGAPYWNQMDSEQRVDVYAFIHGFSGLPGYYLQEPTGSNTDITSSSSANLVNVISSSNTSYKVVLVRKLNTGHTDDVPFNPSQQTVYSFGVALMDNDGINHIGSNKETLKFLSK